MISMNDMADLIMSFENKKLSIKHITGPEGVRGRNSDNSLIREKLGWSPSVPLREGLKRLYFWLKTEIEEERKNGVDVSIYASSQIVTNRTPDQQSK